MPVPYKVKFDEDGSRCPRNIIELREKPECGVIFREEQPFKPDNRFPLPKGFELRHLGKIPEKINIPQGIMPSTIMPMKEDPRRLAFTENELPQDENQVNISRRINTYRTGYERIPGFETELPPIRENIPEISKTFTHQDVDRVIQSLDDIMPTMRGDNLVDAVEEPVLEPPRPIVRQSILRVLPDPPPQTEFIEDDGAGVGTRPGDHSGRGGVGDDEPRGIVLKKSVRISSDTKDIIRQPKSRKTRIRRVIPDPGITETMEKLRPRGMTDTEITETQIQQLKRTMPPDTHKEISSKRKGKMKITEYELITPTPESEEIFILKEAEKFIKTSKRQLTDNEVNKIVEEGVSRGVSPDRTIEILTGFEEFDPAFEKSIRGMNTKEKALMRTMKQTLYEGRLQSIETNLKPVVERQQSIELREDTPLTEGRTDIAKGRSRFRKIYDKTAGKLPEELRYKAKQIRRGYEAISETIMPTGNEFEVAEDTTFERVKASEKATTELGRRLQLEALGVREKMVKGGKKLFAQEFTPVSLQEPVSFEMSDVGAMQLRMPETDTNIQGLRDIPLDPFSDTISSRKLTKLSFAERISAPKVTDVATGGVGAVGGLAIGFGVSQLLDQAKVNKYLNATLSGASADVGGRIITYGAERAALSAGFRTAEVAALTGSTLARGIAEGGVIGLATMPVDMMLNSTLRNAGLSHTASNMISSGVVGTGTVGAIWAAGGVGAGETFGASLVVAALSVGALELIAYLTGQSADREIDKHNSINNTRAEFIKTLPDHNYNFIEALNNFKDIDGLGRKENDWSSWSNNLNNVFRKYPISGEQANKLTTTEDVSRAKASLAIKATSTIANVSPVGALIGATIASATENKDESGLSTDDKLTMQKYFSKYMIHNIVKKVCSGKECSSELLSQDAGELTDEEVAFLNSKTDRAWQSQADMQVEYSIVEMNYTQKRIQEAKQTLIFNWEKNRRLPEQLDDKNILKIASLDPNFKSAFDNAVKLDAQREVVNAYMTNQTKMENLPENIQKAANYDKEFYYMIHVYYQDIEHTAGKMNLSVPQLIQLQGMPQDKQNEMYRKFQFNYAKMDDKTVGEAISISKEEDAVREAGYYDIDQAYLTTDPTAVSIWKPTDSQILQAHSAGMTLQQYVNYMHELSKGKIGDFSKLPNYDPEDIKASGILDFSHFQDELQMGGYDKNMYSYNPETLSITLNTNVNNNPIPSTQNHFISKYTPQNVLQMRQETADLLHGLDQQNQNIVDTYNTQLRKQLSMFGENYNKQVASINDNRSYHGINNLLVFDEDTAYAKQHLEFKPATIVNNVPVHSGDEATKRQLADQSTRTIPNRIKDPEKVGGDYVGGSVPTITDNRPQRDTSYKPGDEPTLDD